MAATVDAGYPLTLVKGLSAQSMSSLEVSGLMGFCRLRPKS